MVLYAQGCSVNAGGNATICGTSYTLQGSTTGTPVGNPTWTLVSKPAGAPDPVISNINSYTPNVTGMTFPGNYVFQMAQSCSSGSGTSQVTIIAPGATTGFTAGPDITGIPAATGVANLNATIPAGYTPSWTYYNIFSYETNGAIVTTNATMSNSTTATPTLTLTNKADHTIDPAYRAVLRITSINNPNCWYEDDAIVRFIPNPNMLWPATSSVCVGPPLNTTSFYYDPNGNSPKISTTTANSSGNPAFGTTVTMAVVSQPAGGNIQYSRMENGRLYFSGIPATATGSYVFDLTIANSLGSYTTRLTYIFNGLQPGALSFVDPAYPNQVELYSFGGSAGSVHCNMVGSTAPITFYYKLNAADSPSLPSTITPVTVIPTGGAPSYVQGGAGTANRSVTLTPPSGGWRAGTYKFTVQVTGGSGCIRTHYYFVHISDNARPAVNVDNITVCYPGSGVVSATVPLPASYIAPASNPSYLQDFGGRYDFTLISGPAGAAVPTYQNSSLRSLTSTSTVISNLDKAGEYVFRIKSAGASGPQKIIDAEYACSGTSPEDTFSVFVSAQVGSNAGSDQTLIATTQATLNGNNPGATSAGTWTLVSKPSGAADPVIVTPSAYNSNVTGLNTTGTYTFRWTIATGTCTSTDDVDIIIPGSCVNNTPTIFYNGDNAGNTYGNTGGTGNLLPFVTASNIAGGTYYKTTGTETLNGVRPKSSSTLFSMSGITNAVQASKYYSFNVTTAANAPVLHFNRFSAIAMDVDLILSPGGMPNVSYNLRVAIVDPDTGSEVNLGNVYVNTLAPVDLFVNYNLKPGKTYQVKLYPWNTNGRTITYLDNPRLYFSPVPNAPASLCLESFSGTVGTVLASYITSTAPAGMEVRWLQNGTDVTGNTVAAGTYTPAYYNTSGSCYADTTGDSVTVTLCPPCPAGCNPNTFVNAVDPNTIEYDNIVSSFHATVLKENSGIFKAWGQETSPNGTGDLLSPTAITSANGFSYIGTPLKATTGSGSDGVTIRHQHALLTTDGLYVWGVNNMLISSSIKNTTAFGKISVNGKTDGLPAGVTPQQVKMMFGSFQTLGIVTCSGEAWVLSMTGDKNGDGSIQNSGTPNSNTVWHRVRTSVAGNPTLDNVVAMRGTANALFALTSDSKLYTWGTGTYINSGGATNRTYATEVSVPAGATPKMIGMTEAGTAQSYYLLATNGKLYTMGDNSSRQLGDGTTAAKNTWVQPLKVTDQSGQGIGVLENIAWISPNEHSRYPTTTAGINVLTNNYKQWAWGYNDNYMLGGASPSSAYDPIYMPGTSAAANGLKVTDELIAVETGGHTSMNIKKGSDKFGYVGHRTNGSMGDGSTANEYIPTYSYQTAIVTVCGAPTSSFCYKPGITAGTALDTKVGISSLGRAGATDADNWPMIRKGGHIALEAKTKAFVPNRVAFDASGNPVGIVAANFVEGMVVYDTTNKCLKMYTSKDNGVSFGWYCITTQTCPD